MSRSTAPALVPPRAEWTLHQIACPHCERTLTYRRAGRVAQLLLESTCDDCQRAREEYIRRLPPQQLRLDL